MGYMFFKKKKENKGEITVEWLIQVGVPPIFAHIIIHRIEEILSKNPKKKAFEASDFKRIPIWPTDQRNLAEMLNRSLKQ
jgi:hypothetical protein